MHGAMYSMNDIVKFILAFAGGLSTIAAAMGWVYKGVKKVKEPSDKIHAELQEHEDKLKKHDEKFEEIDEYLNNDKKAIKEINQGNKIVQKSLLAIMEQFLTDGLDKRPLEEAKQELQQYLIDK